MTYNFDRIVDRTHTRSYKWDQVEALFGAKDILPLWVADMDFPSPPAVIEAIQRRAAEGIYGYTAKDDSTIAAVVEWYRRRHRWNLHPQWLLDSPGVVTSISLAIQSFTEPGDAIILQSPVYHPFYDMIRLNGRELVKNPLISEDSRYKMDLTLLQEQFRGGAKMLLLCNPHNPGSRVWAKTELTQLGELCLQYDVIVVSDEIHGDLTFPGHAYTPFASISPELAKNSITLIAPTKTFNIPGIPVSFAVLPNENWRRRFDHALKSLSLHMTHFFAPVAVEACYREGEQWLDDLLGYLQGNVELALTTLSETLPELKPFHLEGTYLLWLDCRALGLNGAEMKRLMYEKAKVAFNEGSMFGQEGEGFVRINLACPRAILREALERFGKAIRSQ